MSFKWEKLEEIAPLTVKPFKQWLGEKEADSETCTQFLTEKTGTFKYGKIVEGFRKLNKQLEK